MLKGLGYLGWDRYFIYLSAFLSNICADDLASKKSSPTSLMSSLTTFVRPQIFAVTAAGDKSCTAYLKGLGSNELEILLNSGLTV